MTEVACLPGAIANEVDMDAAWIYGRESARLVELRPDGDQILWERVEWPPESPFRAVDGQWWRQVGRDNDYATLRFTLSAHGAW